MNTAKLHQHEVMGFNQYLKCRKDLRPGMIAIRKRRSASLTKNIRLVFENKSTVIYQIQEVLYAARCSDFGEIAAQIDCYKHLLPGEDSLTATLLMEYEDGVEAEMALQHFNGIEKTVFLEVQGYPRVWPVCNEDLEGKDIVSAVHYLRYQLTVEMKRALRNGAAIHLGTAHYRLPIAAFELHRDTRQSLLQDFQG